MTEQPTSPKVPLYAHTIHYAIAGGDLQQMKDLAATADSHLAQYGNVSAALEALKVEIAKMEAKK